MHVDSRRLPLTPARALVALVALLVALAALVALGAGCTPPRAFERETLGSARMRMDDEGGEAFLVRGVTSAREEGHVGGGATGSASGAGGGCGCN